MVRLEEACAKAIAYLGYPENSKIEKILDADDRWVIFLERHESWTTVSNAVVISKSSFEARPFHLPSEENFRVLREAPMVGVPGPYKAKGSF